MDVGYLLDDAHGESRRVTRWVAGSPEKSFWLGLKIKNRPVLPVTTYRCAHCGYLESYASEAAEPR